MEQQFMSIRPMLWTNKLLETIAFYTGVLGFTLNKHNESWQWASIQLGNVQMMLAVPSEQTVFDTPVFTGTFYINTDNVDAVWESLKDKVDIVYAIGNFEWNMREFCIKDNNGYMIQFGQEILTV